MGETDGLSGEISKAIPALVQLPELDTDSIMTEKNNPTQEQKVGEQQVRPTINFSDFTKEMKAGQIHAQRLPIGPETAPLLNNETPWVDYDWAQNDLGVNYYSWGMPMTMPTYWENTPETQNKGQKRGEHSPEWPNLRRDPVGEVYAKSDWALKINERSISKKCLY